MIVLNIDVQEENIRRLEEITGAIVVWDADQECYTMNTPGKPEGIPVPEDAMGELQLSYYRSVSV